MFKYTLPVLAVLGLAACDDGVDTETGADSGDTGTDFDGATTIQDIVAPHCDNGEIVFQVRTQGWTNGESRVNAWEEGATPSWQEQHDLPSVDHGARGWWDELEQRIDAGEEYDENVASTFACDGNEIAHANVYAIRVYDVEGNLAECAIFHLGFDDDADGDAAVQAILNDPTPEFNFVDDPEEIDNCEVWDVAG